MKLNTQGLSLVEVMVSIVILSVIGVAVANIVNQTFSGNNKTQLIGTVKYSGQIAIGMIEKTIRDSETVVCTTPPSAPSTIITFLMKDTGKFIRYTIVPEQGTTNGTIYSDEFTFSTTPTTYTDLCSTTLYPLNQQGTQKILIDHTSKSGVSLRNTSSTGFTVIKNPGFKDTVRINFFLGPMLGNSYQIENSLGGSNSINFQTTVQIR